MGKIENAPFAFEISKKEFDRIWYAVFAKSKMPYSFDERDRLWEKLISEGENTRG